jgi:glycosyltransferase involved in cell wall biosynthesis
VVHEHAAAGFPLICSTTTCAAEQFLEDGRNGFLHAPKSIESLTAVFEKLLDTSDEELLAMGDHSAKLAGRITPVTWSKTALEFINRA